MTTETALRNTLRRAAATIPEADGQLGRVVERGRHRRYRQRAAAVTAVAALAVTLGLTIGSLDLPGAAPVAGGSAAERPDLVIFLCGDASGDPATAARCDAPATQADISWLRAALEVDETVAAVSLETKQEAYERFAELFAGEPELLDSITPEEMPASLRITLADGTDADELVDHYRSFGGVDEVVIRPAD